MFFVIFSHQESRWIIFPKKNHFYSWMMIECPMVWPKVRLIIGCIRIYVIKIDRQQKRVMVRLLLQFTSLINVINTSIVTTKEVFISWNWPCMKWSTLRVGRRLVINVTKNKMKNCSNSKKKRLVFRWQGQIFKRDIKIGLATLVFQQEKIEAKRWIEIFNYIHSSLRSQ